ncbi:glycosyltransferase [Paenibacillus sp. PSB04]|uniref:glycosyltransferase n=1 Tax=Paenibacillus sp. PSB04 TaxID=2866810 RepID=UPI0021F0F63A|nr:glycosyltransferase [Paenibacillus sp. PSB04]UYO05191.1 methyltransferase domain-containing protein [Paenibacillus sp. PSB04]
MQENKMCFITCLNDEVLYEECVLYIKSLMVPEHFEVELIAIRDASSLTEGYNRAMVQSNAKYKIYLHQDTLIINKRFIFDVIELFSKYPTLGMMGVIGAKKLPENAVWWLARERFGKVYDSGRNEMKALEAKEVKGDYQAVEAVDGLIIMTQYDIPWREDKFKGWHMYDISQAMEFKRHGFEVGVPKQEHIWCIHDCGPIGMEGYEEQQSILIEEYSVELSDQNCTLDQFDEKFSFPRRQENITELNYSKEDLTKIYSNYTVNNGVFVSKDSPNINYSDGSEQYLMSVFSKTDSNCDLYKFIKDWSSKYHLTPVRNNILDVIEEVLNTNGKVLELGGGMGAATSWLAKKFNEVDVVEGSLPRALANSLRNKQNNNVQIFVDDLLKLRFPRNEYDLVTLIGVLEYIPFYSDSLNHKQTCIRFLQGVAGHLGNEGVLLLAIENKLGAKYFSGCVEDHNGSLFSGLHGYPDPSAITFSRQELIEILNMSGFSNIQFYHCFPDYKLPKTIMREDSNMYNRNLSNISRGMFEDWSNKREFLMHDALLLESLSDAHLLHEFSNSFLVLCSKNDGVNLKNVPLITKYYNNEALKEEFHHKIQFNLQETQSPSYISRIPLKSSLFKYEIGDYEYELSDEEWFSGRSLSLEAYRCALKQDDSQSLLRLIGEVYSALMEQYGFPNTDPRDFRYVDGKALDFCFNNLIRTQDNRIIFVDRKWRYKGNITGDYVIFRSLLALYREAHPFIVEENAADFILPLMIKIFPHYTKNRMITQFKKEFGFWSTINKESVNETEFSSHLFDKTLNYQNEVLKKLLIN